MKRLVALSLLLAVAGASLVSAQDEGWLKKSLTVDAGAGLSFGLFDSMPSPFGDLSGIATAASVRVGVDGGLFYKMNDVVEVGPMIGVYYLNPTVNGVSYIFFDVPLRAAVKIGMGSTFIEPYVGYYVASYGFPFPGVELGARGALGGFFVEGSYVLGNPNWKHIAFGYTLTNGVLPFRGRIFA